jgi:hypothetical protein
MATAAQIGVNRQPLYSGSAASSNRSGASFGRYVVLEFAASRP